jgi:hypothetical protein
VNLAGSTILLAISHVEGGRTNAFIAFGQMPGRRWFSRGWFNGFAT